MFSYEQIQGFNDLEREVYQYVLANIEKVPYLRIRELADEAHVSTSTVLRFCKKAGCDGYAEFKLRIKEYSSIKPNRDLENDHSEIQHFIRNLEMEDYQRRIKEAVEILKGSQRILFVGVGNSGCIAEYAARYFSNIGELSFAICDPFYPIPTRKTNRIAVVVLSTSGETEQTIEIQRKFKEAGCRIISICNSENCTAARLSECCLPYYLTKVRENDLDFTSQAAALIWIETLGKLLRKEKT